jgi:hypothetical protein
VNQHEENILKFLNEATQPVDVEKVRTACGIGNWNTAHKHCLDLTLQGKIQGQKTSRGWIFWAHQNVQLKPWEEAVGTLDKVEDTDTQTIAYLTCAYKKQITISLPKEQPKTTQKLQNLIGRRITILKTDNPKKPIIITEKRLAQQQSRPKAFYGNWHIAKRVASFYEMLYSIKGAFLCTSKSWDQ